MYGSAKRAAKNTHASRTALAAVPTRCSQICAADHRTCNNTVKIVSNQELRFALRANLCTAKFAALLLQIARVKLWMFVDGMKSKPRQNRQRDSKRTGCGNNIEIS